MWAIQPGITNVRRNLPSRNVPILRDVLLANATYAWFEGLPGSGNVGSWTDIVAGEVASINGTTSGCVVSTLNAKPAILFNATGNLVTPAFAAGAIIQPLTVISVFDWNIATSFRYVHDGIISTNRAALLRDATPQAQIVAGIALNADTNFSANPTYTACTYNGLSSSINLEGVTKNGSAGTHTLTGLTIGALNGNTNRFSGTIAMIAIVGGANGTARTANILAALQSYYGF